jgi:hypothetical protein
LLELLHERPPDSEGLGVDSAGAGGWGGSRRLPKRHKMQIIEKINYERIIRTLKYFSVEKPEKVLHVLTSCNNVLVNLLLMMCFKLLIAFLAPNEDLAALADFGLVFAWDLSASANCLSRSSFFMAKS